MMRRWTKKFSEKVPKISVVVSVYNKPREVEMVLEGYLRQSVLKNDPQAFELILADDGSNSDIESLCHRFSEDAPFPFTFLWQKDQGWGKPRMLNWAIHEARAERIVFTDGDCIPHSRFIESHIESSEEGSVLCGRRVDLMQKITPTLSIHDVRSGLFDSRLWLSGTILRDDVDFGTQGFYLPKPITNLIYGFTRKPTLLGSNFSIYKKHLVDLNGFDESFTVPGIGEDTDMQRRFELAGLKINWITYRAIQFHLWHKLTSVGETAHKIFEDLKAAKNTRAVKGLKEFLASSKLPSE